MYHYYEWTCESLPWFILEQDSKIISVFHPNYILIEELGK